ncbi:UDP-galactopyranose mutase [Colidextribacter sp. OB.20]|uniref:UDP-galactopyranose mutase n=1 Tax=Colidextribacter sp. OB.20 TaxID=2304568 RepID=UPI00136CE83F|nr:UDP-galactopyranose mutase [Colidextribacter sp. OB.20]
MLERYDIWIAGAGYAGAVSARALAERGKKVLVLERRDHIGGNAYDCLDDHGVLIHKYGPHIFHTNNRAVFDFLSRFTEWRRYQHRVIANVPRDNPEVVPAHKKTDGRFFFPVPFNLDSLKNAFGEREGGRLGEKLLAAYPAQSQVTILELRQNPDPEVAAIADYVYEHVFVHYTMKQWGQKPEDIDPNTTARVPVRLSRDDRYFQDAYQGMPAEGYTKMFEKMLDHPNIEVLLNTDVRQYLSLEEYDIFLRGAGAPLPCPLIYTGPLDEFFGLCYGRLPYRTLDFQFETLPQDAFQTHGTVNYTVDQDFTRITEFKHLTGQELPGVTTIVKEFSRPYTGDPRETPYYAIINPENNALYAKYKAEADKKQQLHLLGRLAEYKYYNMDAIAARALELAERL